MSHYLLKNFLLKVKNLITSYVKILLVNVRWISKKDGKSNLLDSTLVLTLTSYKPRFVSLPLTLKCLLSQSVSPDRIILWIAHDDKKHLTDDIWKLEKEGLEIKFCDDLKSYKKIIPTLKLLPDAFIVTADDDLYYHRRWLEELVNAYLLGPKNIICHRAHQIKLDKDQPLKYRLWDLNTKNYQPSPLIFPTSGGGVLYPPKCFHRDIVDESIFMELCPKADDLWLYWMFRLNGTMAIKIRGKWTPIEWSGTQRESLKEFNYYEGGNDAQIKALLTKYGFPRQ